MKNSRMLHVSILEFVQSIEFDRSISSEEKFFHQTKYEYMHGYLRCLRFELDRIIAEEKDI